ncbi:hypothetical protein ACFWDI_36280 [Streptomyces sp. NPDC060064]|uniref:hypothetical protein n=1 Tax=Streptomyces sp. NPDC060064 TaxID=3347049 RepID=UPI0036C87714
MSIADEIRDEIDQLGAAKSTPGLAAVAIRLAQALDAIPIDEAPTSQAVVADKLTAAMTKLRALAPVKEEGDAVHDIARQREKRREAAAQAVGRSV